MEPGPLYIVSSVKRLDPLMKNLLTDCSIQTVFSVAEIIPTVDQRALQKLHPYLLVPMLKELANIKLKKEVKTALLSCVNNILSRVRISSVLAVKNVLHSLMLEVFDKDSPSMIKNISEEMKLSVMDCALSTITNMPYEVQEKFYTKENIPEICQIAYICLELAVSEKMRLLRIRAMEVVLALQQSPLDGPDLRSPWERKEIADIFQYILPGACSKLMTIVTGDITQGSKVLSAAIFTVSSMIALVMEDYPDCEVDNPSNMVKALVQLSRASDLNQEPKDFQENVPHNASGAKKLIESSQGRTLEWRKKIAIHLMPFLTKLGAQCEHSDPKICKVVATSCSLIILRCPLTLKECLAPLLDAVIALSVHENIAVKEESSNFLKKMAEYSADQNSHDFIQLAKENFYMLLTRLPRMVQREGGCNGAASLALVSGYVRLLHHSLHNILSSSVHLQRLTLSLLHVVTVECSSVNVASEHFTRLLNYEQYTNYCVPWIQLRFSPNRAVLTYMEQLFNILVEESVGTFDLIGSQLMDTLESVPHFKKESILLLNMLLLAAWNRKNYSACEMGVSLLDLYIAPDLELANDIGKAVTTISVVQESITLKCLVAEGISCCIQVMGKDRAQAHLLRSLYPLLELAGSANGSISLAGLRALSRVADVFGYNSNLVPLVSNNMDYLSHCMSIRLRHINNNLGVFDALSLILRHYSPEIALGLNSIVLNVLHQSSDVTQSKNNEAHLRVFLTFALGMQQWLKPKLDCSFTTSQSFSLVKSEVLDGTPSEAVHMVGSSYLSRNVHWNAVQKLKTYQTNLDIYSKGEILSDEAYDPSEELQPDKQPHNMVDSLNEGDLVDTALDKTDTTAELLRLLELILKRCLHFVPSPVVDHQFLAMKTLEVGLKTLHPFTNTLLPIVHLIWSPLVGRFEESQPPLVIRTAFKLLETMALTSKDFILSRTVRDIFPQLAKFLKHSVRESHLKDRASVYRFSQNYKTQVALLLGLGPLCCNLQLRGQDFYSLLSVCLPYLSSQQPRPLQVAAACSIRFLSRLDADAVWWALVSWWTPPHLALSLELLQSSLHQDCEENVKLLLGLSLSSKEEDIIGFSDLQN